MSEQNKELVRLVNESFLNGNVEMVSEYLDENIKWNIVGMPSIQGKSDFIKTMQMMEFQDFLNLKIKKIIAEGNYVVVENSGSLNKDTYKPYTPSYCDIYLIRNGKVIELTTYIVDITLNNEL